MIKPLILFFTAHAARLHYQEGKSSWQYNFAPLQETILANLHFNLPIFRLGFKYKNIS
jgi:hypothetical protein